MQSPLYLEFFLSLPPSPPRCVCHIRVSHQRSRFVSADVLPRFSVSDPRAPGCRDAGVVTWRGVCLELVTKQNSSSLEVWQKIVSYIILLDFFLLGKNKRKLLAGRRLLPCHRNMFSHMTAARAKPLAGPAPDCGQNLLCQLVIKPLFSLDHETQEY